MADKFFVVGQRRYVIEHNYNGTCSTRTDRVENKLTQIFFYIIPEDSSSSSGLVGGRKSDMWYWLLNKSR